MKIRVIFEGSAHVDYHKIETFSLLKDWLWMTYEDGTDTFVNRNEGLQFFHVTRDDEDDK